MRETKQGFLAEVYKVIRHLDRSVNSDTKRMKYCERSRRFRRGLFRDLVGPTSIEDALDTSAC